MGNVEKRMNMSTSKHLSLTEMFLTLFSFVFLMIMLYVGLYAVPNSDDFSFTVVLMEKGSLFKALLYYMANWTPRFINYLYAIPITTFAGTAEFERMPLIYALLLIVTFYFFQFVYRKLLDTPLQIKNKDLPSRAWTVPLISTAVFYATAPGIGQVFYWMSGQLYIFSFLLSGLTVTFFLYGMTLDDLKERRAGMFFALSVMTMVMNVFVLEISVLFTGLFGIVVLTQLFFLKRANALCDVFTCSQSRYKVFFSYMTFGVICIVLASFIVLSSNGTAARTVWQENFIGGNVTFRNLLWQFLSSGVDGIVRTATSPAIWLSGLFGTLAFQQSSHCMRKICWMKTLALLFFVLFFGYGAYGVVSLKYRLPWLEENRYIFHLYGFAWISSFLVMRIPILSTEVRNQMPSRIMLAKGSKTVVCVLCFLCLAFGSCAVNLWKTIAQNPKDWYRFGMSVVAMYDRAGGLFDTSKTFGQYIKKDASGRTYDNLFVNTEEKGRTLVVPYKIGWPAYIDMPKLPGLPSGPTYDFDGDWMRAGKTPIITVSEKVFDHAHALPTGMDGYKNFELSEDGKSLNGNPFYPISLHDGDTALFLGHVACYEATKVHGTSERDYTRRRQLFGVCASCGIRALKLGTTLSINDVVWIKSALCNYLESGGNVNDMLPLSNDGLLLTVRSAFDIVVESILSRWIGTLVPVLSLF